MPGSGHELIGFWAPFFDPWFRTIWSVGKIVFSNDFEQCFEHPRMHARLSCMDVESVGPLPECVAGALEAYALDRDVVQCCGMLHETADTVVGNGMHDYLFADHRRRFATQNVHAHCDLDIPKKQLDGPAPEVQPAKFFNGPFDGGEQGR